MSEPSPFDPERVQGLQPVDEAFPQIKGRRSRRRGPPLHPTISPTLVQPLDDRRSLPAGQVPYLALVANAHGWTVLTHAVPGAPLTPWWKIAADVGRACLGIGLIGLALASSACRAEPDAAPSLVQAAGPCVDEWHPIAISTQVVRCSSPLQTLHVEHGYNDNVTGFLCECAPPKAACVAIDLHLPDAGPDASFQVGP